MLETSMPGTGVSLLAASLIVLAAPDGPAVQAVSDFHETSTRAEII